MKVVVKVMNGSEWRNMNEKEILCRYFITRSLLIIVIDQVTKWIIASSMKIGDSYEVIPNF